MGEGSGHRISGHFLEQPALGPVPPAQVCPCCGLSQSSCHVFASLVPPLGRLSGQIDHVRKANSWSVCVLRKVAFQLHLECNWELKTLMHWPRTQRFRPKWSGMGSPKFPSTLAENHCPTLTWRGSRQWGAFSGLSVWDLPPSRMCDTR